MVSPTTRRGPASKLEDSNQHYWRLLARKSITCNNGKGEIYF